MITALALGLIAALAWGVHDVCVRFVSQRAGIFPALATVLLSGAVLVLPVVALWGDWSAMTAPALGLSVLSGLMYVVGCIGLYRAFGIGPVRLVAPIIGAYPILSLGWGALRGQPISVDQGFAVLAIIAGVAVVAAMSDSAESQGNPAAAIMWSLIGGAGFAMTFAIGQMATRAGSELPVVLCTRITTVCVVLALLYRSGGTLRSIRPHMALLILMGALDAAALGIVIGSGALDHPEFTAVAASTFGMITIILAWVFLRERMTWPQWAGVALAFAGIGYLGH